MFPDDSKFEKSKDGTEPILGCSVGFNRVLLGLRTQAYNPSRLRWSAVLISAFTVFRNVYTKEATLAELAVRFRQDIDLFQIYFDAYSTIAGNPPTPIPVVLYVPNYTAIPKPMRRDPNPTQDAIEKRFAEFIRTLPGTESVVSTTVGSCVWCVSMGISTMLPHIQLAQWLQSKALMSPHFGYKHGLPVMIISHCPIDLHIQKRLPKTYLVESYQGVVRPPREFGRKLLHCDETIPFNTATHRAFGDSIHLEPIVTREQRKTLLEMAVKKKWIQQPAEAVMRDIITVTKTSVAELTKLSL